MVTTLNEFNKPGTLGGTIYKMKFALVTSNGGQASPCGGRMVLVRESAPCLSHGGELNGRGVVSWIQGPNQHDARSLQTKGIRNRIGAQRWKDINQI